MTLAPIILFTYNRPKHTERTLQALLQNKQSSESELFIFSDGNKGEHDKAHVEQVRELIHRTSGFKKVHIVESKVNKGLANSIIDGVTRIVNEYGRVIVMEDDLIVSPWFLTFMNEALERFKEEERIGHIQAFCYPDMELPDTFLIKWTGSLGWGTWDRAWRYFNPNGAELLAELEMKNLTRDFDFNGSNRFTRMLRRQIAGEIDSWAIRWYASLFLNNLLALNAGKSLVQNIGFDGTGVHSGGQEIFKTTLYNKKIIIDVKEIEENRDVRHAFEKYYRKTYGFWAKVRRRIKRHLKI